MKIYENGVGFMMNENFLSDLFNSAGRRSVVSDVHCALHIFLYFSVYFSLNNEFAL